MTLALFAPIEIISAKGHLWGDEDLICANPGCSVSWAYHQTDPQPCQGRRCDYWAHNQRESASEEAR